MSDAVFDAQADKLRRDQQIADLERAIAGIQRSREETTKFIREAHKLQAEAAKLDAEAMKLRRDRGLAPWLAVVGLIGGLLAIANFVSRFFH